MGCNVSAPVKVRERYIIIAELGKGASGHVFSAQNKLSGQKCALKEMNNTPLTNHLWKTECALFTELQSNPHPNVLDLVETAKEDFNLYIMTSLCEGGELFKRVGDLHRSNSVTEYECSTFARMMITSVCHIHSLDIVHRDLKPENYVFESTKDNSSMKLIDFGGAVKVVDDKVVDGYAGTVHYMAPEVATLVESFNTRPSTMTGASWKAADMWSVGVIIYLFLVGAPPFFDKHFRPVQIGKKIRAGKYRWPKMCKASQSVRDLVSNLLKVDPLRRLTAEQALKHPWTTGADAPQDKMDGEVFANLDAFTNMCKLKKAVANVLHNQMTGDQKKQVMGIFKEYDTNGDGRLDANEINKLMDHIGRGSAVGEAVLAKFDEDGDGDINIDEFKSVSGAGAIATDTKGMRAQFNLFDKSGDGYITQRELHTLCNDMTRDSIMVMINEADNSGDGRLDFEEWCKAMSAATSAPIHKKK